MKHFPKSTYFKHHYSSTLTADFPACMQLFPSLRLVHEITYLIPSPNPPSAILRWTIGFDTAISIDTAPEVTFGLENVDCPEPGLNYYEDQV